MTTNNENILPQLRETLANTIQNLNSIQSLRRLSGGASQETWAFNAITPDDTIPLILRRAPGGAASGITHGATKVTLELEAELISRAETAGVCVPSIQKILQPDDKLGSGFVMSFVQGETIARKILRDDKYAQARPILARQCGEVAARIHTISIDGLEDKLPQSPPISQLNQYRDLLDTYDYPHPVFEIAFQWLQKRVPETPELCLVHGDFRHGNLIIGEDGLRAVLDWELAHLGDPMEDLGWVCVNSWRFGNHDKPVGGFGQRQDLFQGYQAAGGATVDPARVKYWETFGTLKWGMMCMSMYAAFKNGPEPSVERATIGRRSSETEIDLMNLLAGD